MATRVSCTVVFVLLNILLETTVDEDFTRSVQSALQYCVICAAQTFVLDINSVLLTGLEFNCRIGYFLSLWYLLLIDFNVIRNYI